MSPLPRTAVLVLGMHRSGTSVLTRLIGELGVALPADPAPPLPDNPEGFWEPAGLMRLHDRLFWELGTAWFDLDGPDLAGLPDAVAEDYLAEMRRGLRASFGDARCFVLKDPRICRMVPLYRELLAEMGADVRVILALREPSAVIASLHRRNLLSIGYAGLLCASHMLAAERATRDLPRIVVSYDALMADWRSEGERITAFLAGAAEPFDWTAVRSPVQPGLRHHRARPSDPRDRLGGLLSAIHEAIAGAAAPDELDRLAALYGRMRHALRDLLRIEFQALSLIPPHAHLAPLQPTAARFELASALARLQCAALEGDGRRPEPNLARPGGRAS